MSDTSSDLSPLARRRRILKLEIKLTRVAPKTWRATVRLPRAGRWRLVVANGAHLGFMVPPPTAWMPWANVHA